MSADDTYRSVNGVGGCWDVLVFYALSLKSFDKLKTTRISEKGFSQCDVTLPHSNNLVALRLLLKDVSQQHLNI